MFQAPPASPLDLRWRMFGIGVRVHPSFWLVSGLLGLQIVSSNPQMKAQGLTYILLWIGCTFASVLIHELGHVVTGRVFDQPSNIVLFMLGGLAIGTFHLARCWQRVLIAAGGPAAGFFLLGAVVLFQIFLLPIVDPTGAMLVLRRGLAMLFWMNLVWSALNLIPIFPLDGGQIFREILTGLSPRNGPVWSLGLSLFLSLAVVGYSLLKVMGYELPYYPPVAPDFNILMFGLLAFQSWQMYQRMKQERRQVYEDEEDEKHRW